LVCFWQIEKKGDWTIHFKKMEFQHFSPTLILSV
jgi:hypothetical protein